MRSSTFTSGGPRALSGLGLGQLLGDFEASVRWMRYGEGVYGQV
jgi:hypothetical protein